MKKVIALIFVLMLLLTGCDIIEENNSDLSFLEGLIDIGPANTDSAQDESEHNYVETILAPTCESAGYTICTCSICDDAYVTDVVEATGHTEVPIQDKAANCTEDGSIGGTICSVCDKILTQPTKLSAPGHKYDTAVTLPTCEDNGYTTYNCTICDYEYVGDEINANGHDYNIEVTLPSCVEGGYTKYSCTACNYEYIGDEVESKGHTEELIPGTKPTEDTDGLTDGKKCSDCGTILLEQVTIPAKGHTYVSVVTPPTCTSDGYITYTCEDCGDSYQSNIVNSLGHTEITLDGKQPTCTSTGLTEGKQCSVCKVVTVAQQSVAALGHTETTLKGKDATCTSDGLTEGKKCSVCGVITKIQVTIKATGHSWLPATVTAPKTCQICGVTEGDKLPSTPSETNETLYVHYIDVGQGDSILIKIGDCDILIDGGKPAYGSTVSSYLKNQNVDDIELMINTHFDDDHYGGLNQVLADFVVEDFWCSGYEKSNNSITKFKANVTKEGLELKTPATGTVYTYQEVTLTVIYNGDGASSSNDSSIVVMLKYGSSKFLFTGDIGQNVESKLVSSGADLSCDVLKVGHHGSRTSSTSSFLKATGAKYGVICVGADNTYGHPTSTALNNLAAAGISVYRTDKNGDVVFSTDGTNLTIPGGDVVTATAYSARKSTLNSSYDMPKKNYSYYIVIALVDYKSAKYI